jgi:hypothetical protein
MKITIALPDDIAEKVCRLPDRDEFVARAVEAALAHEPQKTIPAGTEPSRWAQLVERIERQPATLDGYREEMARDGREFRRSFRFPHDES